MSGIRKAVFWGSLAGAYGALFVAIAFFMMNHRELTITFSGIALAFALLFSWRLIDRLPQIANSVTETPPR